MKQGSDFSWNKTLKAKPLLNQTDCNGAEKTDYCQKTGGEGWEAGGEAAEQRRTVGLLRPERSR